MAAVIRDAATTPTAAELARPGAATAWRSAREFEGVTLAQLLAPMFDTVDQADSAFGGGPGETAFRPMMTQEIARSIAAHGGLGLALPVFRQLLRAQEAGDPGNPADATGPREEP